MELDETTPLELETEENTATIAEPTNTEQNFGFSPLELEPEKPAKVTQSPACQLLREQINVMLTDFPELQLRSSAHTMATLMQYDELELSNILKNCHSDLRLIRGMPAAEFGIYMVGALVERVARGQLEGYTERCQNDTDLLRDIEAEMTLLFGGFGRRMNILFRLVNNAYQQLVNPEADYNNWEAEEDPHVQEVRARDEKEAYVRRIPPDGERDRRESAEERPRKRTRTSGGSRATSD